MRALLVDDDYLSRTSLKELLSKYADCDAVSNGNLALEMFKIAHTEYAPYNVVTMDIEMPRMSGQEVVGKIRAVEKEMGIPGSKAVKIVMVSAMSDLGNVSKSYIEGCDGYLRKPANEETLAKALKEVGVIE